ncbi:hypothetical protein BKA93DRAFT_367469 [Sparassis latifolia]
MPSQNIRNVLPSSSPRYPHTHSLVDDDLSPESPYLCEPSSFGSQHPHPGSEPDEPLRIVEPHRPYLIPVDDRAPGSDLDEGFASDGMPASPLVLPADKCELATPERQGRTVRHVRAPVLARYASPPLSRSVRLFSCSCLPRTSPFVHEIGAEHARLAILAHVRTRQFVSSFALQPCYLFRAPVIIECRSPSPLYYMYDTFQSPCTWTAKIAAVVCCGRCAF